MQRSTPRTQTTTKFVRIPLSKFSVRTATPPPLTHPVHSMHIHIRSKEPDRPILTSVRLHTLEPSKPVPNPSTQMSFIIIPRVGRQSSSIRQLTDKRHSGRRRMKGPSSKVHLYIDQHHQNQLTTSTPSIVTVHPSPPPASSSQTTHKARSWAPPTRYYYSNPQSTCDR